MSDTILEIFESRVHDSATLPALRRRRSGVWQTVSWKEWWEASERIAAGLVALGVGHGDRVAIIANTSSRWLFCDIAIQMLGAVTVPVYPSLGPGLVQQILDDAGAVAVVVADPSQLDKLVARRAELPTVAHVFWMEPELVRPYPDFKGRMNVRLAEVLDDGDPWNCSLEALAASGRRALAQDSQIVSRMRREVAAEDLATLVYTSGTTGQPRGVMLTHGNLVAQVEALRRLEIFEPEDVQYLFLPLAHIFARVLYLAAVGYGIETVVADDMRQILVEMQECEPTFFAAVPQIFEQVRSKIESEASRGSLRERLFQVAERVGRESEKARKKLGRGVLGRVGRKVIAEVGPARARQIFGGRVRFAISGGAPLNPATAEWFAAFGLPVLEGYGLTETTAVATVNLPERPRIGTVGRPLPTVDITIDEDSEVLMRGPTLSPGYWRDDAATAASRDDEGWFKTGDLGQFDRDGFLAITGRKKELIVTAGGKNVPPAPIEAQLESIGVVDRAWVHGDRRPFLVALLTLRAEAVHEWAREHGVAPSDVPSDERFRTALDDAVTAVSGRSPGYAVVRRWDVLTEPFSQEHGELTATGKLRRSRLEERHDEILGRLFEDRDPRM